MPEIRPIRPPPASGPKARSPERYIYVRGHKGYIRARCAEQKNQGEKKNMEPNENKTPKTNENETDLPSIFLGGGRKTGGTSNIREGRNLLTGEATTVRRVIGFVPVAICDVALADGVSLQKLTEVAVTLYHRQAIKAIKKAKQ